MEKRKLETYVEKGKNLTNQLAEDYKETFNPLYFDKILYYAKCLIVLGRFDEARDFIYPLLSKPYNKLDQKQKNNESNLLTTTFRMEFESVVRAIDANDKKELEHGVNSALFLIDKLRTLGEYDLNFLDYHEILLSVLSSGYRPNHYNEPRHKSFEHQVKDYSKVASLDHIIKRNDLMTRKNRNSKFEPRLLRAQFNKAINLEALFDEVTENVKEIPRNESIDPFSHAFIVYDPYEFDLPNCGVCQGGKSDHVRALVVPGTNNVSELYPIPKVSQPRIEGLDRQYTLTSQRKMF